MRFTTPALFTAAHPDDIEGSSGGTLRSLTRSSGGCVSLWYATEGDNLRTAEAEAAAACLGVDQLQFGGYTDLTLDNLDRGRLVGSLDGIIASTGAQTIFAPHPEDTHSDHRALGLAAQAAVRRLPVSLLLYRTPSTIEASWQPSVYVPLTEAGFTAKLSALSEYRSQAHRSCLDSTVVSAQSIVDGYPCGYPLAEAFQLWKGVWGG